MDPLRSSIVLPAEISSDTDRCVHLIAHLGAGSSIEGALQ